MCTCSRLAQRTHLCARCFSSNERYFFEQRAHARQTIPITCRPSALLTAVWDVAVLCRVPNSRCGHVATYMSFTVCSSCNTRRCATASWDCKRGHSVVLVHRRSDCPLVHSRRLTFFAYSAKSEVLGTLLVFGVLCKIKWARFGF